MTPVKLETLYKVNITPNKQLDACRKTYYEGGGKERMADYYKNRHSPEQKERKRQKCREWKARNRDRMRILRFASNCKYRIRDHYQGEFEVWELIGCNCAELAIYLDQQCEPGMDWRNGRSFEIDHIRPLCSFNLTDLSQIRECFHFSNLQVLPRNTNIEKAKAEHMDFMERKAREWWASVKTEEYPGFRPAWIAFSRRNFAKQVTCSQ